ncbi:unnamed protein product [Anisakis simplex]|uniref:Pinch, putative (inferred by orthology to a S. mansoni protein) n=1 Tax=Anisakis simplex TaxID=6269 RepID=A0A0M3JY75_ANISI|nr:unnamed protein product [Anisakis simplex]
MDRPLQLSIPGHSPSFSATSTSSQNTSSINVPIDPLSPLSAARCARCQQLFASGEVFISTGSKTWHNECFRCSLFGTFPHQWHQSLSMVFRCAQCFCSLLNDMHFTVDGRNYCEHDFKALYAPTCAKCKDFIMGRVIKAANCSWHPQCFRCEQCNTQLDNEGVWHYAGRNLCMTCNKLAKKEGGKLCSKCFTYIEPGKQLRYRHEDYHAYHFNCNKCGYSPQFRATVELNEKARIHRDDLYCPRCFDQMCHVCAACRHPIDDERSVFALQKHWHIDHFLCAKCEKPFYGSKHFEKRERAYCESCYKKGWNSCWRMYCWEGEGQKEGRKTISKVIEMDMRPICKKCFDKFPKELKQRMV